MKTLPDFRDLRELLHLVDRSSGQHRAGRARRSDRPGGAVRPSTTPADARVGRGFVDCRGVMHTWDEED